MARQSPKRLPLPKRFSAALTEPAYDRLRRLNSRYGLGNNYLLTVLLERLDAFSDAERLDAAFKDFIEEYGAPAPARGAADLADDDKNERPEAEPPAGAKEDPI